MTIGFIGQGFIGKNYADELESRGFSVVRYARRDAYAKNKDRIADCEIVFIAVPTPTTPDGFDASIVEEVLPLVGAGNIAVIKSTILPGTTERLQARFPDQIVLHSPEFLREAHAAADAKHPERNIVGIPADNRAYREAAEKVLAVLPEAPYTRICSAREAELTKYGGNIFLTLKVIYANLMYDLAQTEGADWDVVKENIGADPRIGGSHLDPVHASGRGAGGHCFIKDLAAFRELYARMRPEDEQGIVVLRALEEKNLGLLRESGKDQDLVEDIYGSKG